MPALVARQADQRVEFAPADQSGIGDPEATDGRAEDLSGSLAGLGASVFTYGNGSEYYGDEPLQLHGAGGNTAEFPQGLDLALPDGRGGIFTQEGNTIAWYADPAHSSDATTLEIRGDRMIELAAVFPQGTFISRELSSSGDDPESVTGYSQARYGPTADDPFRHQPLGSESTRDGTTGIVNAAGTENAMSPVHISCPAHLQTCGLYEGVFGTDPNSSPLYANNSVIHGLAATRDGATIAFVEAEPHDLMTPSLVLLDGRSFEVLAKISLPPDPDARDLRIGVSPSRQQR